MKKLFAILLVAAMILSAFAGCGGVSTSSIPNETDSASALADVPEAEPAVELEPTHEEASEPDVEEASAEPVDEAPQASLSYPLVTDGSEQVTVWVSLPPHVAPYMEDVSESAAYRAAAEATGIKMVTTTVSAAVEAEQFQLMCAGGTTGDYDIIVGATRAYGSADAAIEDEIVIDLSDYLAEYMPDYYNFLQSDEEVRKLLTTDSGAIADIAGRATGGRPQGFGIRKDWLDKSGLDIPTTYDELYNVLTVFKNDYNCPEPLLMFSTGFLDNDFLCSGFGMTQNGYYVEDGTVKFERYGKDRKKVSIVEVAQK